MSGRHRSFIMTLSSPLCSNDFVALYKNNEMNGENLINKLCGSELPTKDIKCRGNILVNFVTNDKNEGNGWELQFDTMKCGGELTGKSGSIR
jgi:hypothetical protein